MADIRINALATTATTPASDDYLALDGAAQGTRKILATNIANNVTDVILGTSGPSVKSSIAARAPRQGLVFDGSLAEATFTIPAFGTSPYTVQLVARQTSAATQRVFWAAANGAFIVYVGSNGSINWGISGSATVATSAGVFAAGVNQDVVITRVSTAANDFKIYVNGVVVYTGTDANNYTTASNSLSDSTADAFSGTLLGRVYNRALSASEVVALYEAGAPAGADYPGTAAGTSLSVNAFDATRWSSSFATFTGASATGFTATRASGAGDDSVTSDSFTVKKGDVIRCVFDMTNSADLPYIYLGDASTGAQRSTTLPQTTAGSAQVFLLTASAAGSVRVAFYTGNAQTANYTVANFTARPLGLLLAPDAAQAGGGLVWYDTSGNAANITLPASGVTWNVPSSRVLGGNWTTSGNLTVSGTGTSSVAGSFQVGATSEPGKISLFQSGTKTYSTSASIDSDYWGVRVNNTSAANQAVALQLAVSSDNGTTAARGVISAIQPTAGVNTGALAFQTNTGGTISETMRLISGNALLGTTTDSGNGKLQLATHTTSAGGIGFGTDTSLYRGASGIGTLELSASSGTVSIFKVALAGTAKAQFGIAAGATYIDYDGSLIVRNGIGGTTALTLDSSQNATFAGTVTATVNKSAANYTTVTTYVAAGSTTTTVHTFANANTNRSWLVSTRQQGAASNTVIGFATTYGGTLVVYRIAQSNTTGGVLDMNFTASGLNLQLVLGSGFGSTTWDTTITPIQG